MLLEIVIGIILFNNDKKYYAMITIRSSLVFRVR